MSESNIVPPVVGVDDAEQEDDDEEDLDTTACKPCNRTFDNSRAFYAHIYSVGHLQRVNDMEKPTTTASTSSVSQPNNNKPRGNQSVSTSVIPRPLLPWPPIVEGRWRVVKPVEQTENSGVLFKCNSCRIMFEDRISYILHMAGLKHKQRLAEQDNSNSMPFIGSQVTPFEAVGPVQDLNPHRRLYDHPGPLLGVDYVTEYRFLDGSTEYACDLCEIKLAAFNDVIQHVISLTHHLGYIHFHEPTLLKGLKDLEKPEVRDKIHKMAADLEKKHGRKFRIRVKLETDLSPKDLKMSLGGPDTSPTNWMDLDDQMVRPISALSGHRLFGAYLTGKVSSSLTKLTSVEQLLDTLAVHSAAVQSRPPSMARPMSRCKFIQEMGKLNVRCNDDAEVCLQTANSLTLALLNYRLRLLPTLRPIDQLKFEDKLNVLRKDAVAVCDKICGPGTVDENETTASV